MFFVLQLEKNYNQTNSFSTAPYIWNGYLQILCKGKDFIQFHCILLTFVFTSFQKYTAKFLSHFHKFKIWKFQFWWWRKLKKSISQWPNLNPNLRHLCYWGVFHQCKSSFSLHFKRYLKGTLLSPCMTNLIAKMYYWVSGLYYKTFYGSNCCCIIIS